MDPLSMDDTCCILCVDTNWYLSIPCRSNMQCIHVSVHWWSSTLCLPWVVQTGTFNTDTNLGSFYFNLVSEECFNYDKFSSMSLLAVVEGGAALTFYLPFLNYCPWSSLLLVARLLLKHHLPPCASLSSSFIFIPFFPLYSFLFADTVALL